MTMPMPPVGSVVTWTDEGRPKAQVVYGTYAAANWKLVVEQADPGSIRHFPFPTADDVVVIVTITVMLADDVRAWPDSKAAGELDVPAEPVLPAEPVDDETGVVEDVLMSMTPTIGSVWEPMNSLARARIKIVEVKWNGAEVWVGTVQCGRGMYEWETEVIWNEWTRFIEAAVLVEVPE